MKQKNEVFVAFDFLGFWPIIICKNIVKIFHNNDMVEVQIWNLWKTIQCDNNLSSPNVMYKENLIRY
jgi:hypothetical protein